MFLKALFVLSGIAGTAASVGIPIVVQEFQRLSSVWGKDWVNAPFLTSLSTLSGILDKEKRKRICQELGFSSNQHSSSSVSTGNDWNYDCNTGDSGSHLKEETKSSYYEWSLHSNTQFSIKCLRIQTKDSGGESNTGVDWSQCRKK